MYRNALDHKAKTLTIITLYLSSFLLYMHKYEIQILDIVKNLFPVLGETIPVTFSIPPNAELGDIAVGVF